MEKEYAAHHPAGHSHRTRHSSAVLAGIRGERFQISVLGDDLIRVQLFPEGEPCLGRTWPVVSRDSAAPREGRRNTAGTA